MQCTAARADRLVEMRNQLVVRDRQIADLEKELNALSASIAATTGPVSIRSAAEKQPSSTIAILCGSKDACRDVPLADVGNATIELKAELDNEMRGQKLLEKTVHELELQIKLKKGDNFLLERRLEDLSVSTGFTKCELATVVKEKNKPVPSAEELREMAEFIALKRRELSAAEVILKRKSDVATQLARIVAVHRSLQNELSQATNDFRVADRSVQERKEALKAVLKSHAALDVEVEAIKQHADVSTKALLEADTAQLVRRNGSLIEARRAEDRVVKAQELRLAMLQSRLDVVHDAVGRHGLGEVMEARLPPLLTQMEAQDGDPSALLEQYTRMEHIMPHSETVPASVYALFEMDLDHRRRAVRRLDVMIAEKHATVQSLGNKVAEMSTQQDEVTDAMFDSQQRQEAEREAIRQRANALLEKHKCRYLDVLAESRHVKERITVLKSGSQPTSARSRRSQVTPRASGTA